MTGVPLTQAPVWHSSSRVQGSPSLHGVPFAAGGFEHNPVEGSQLPALWQESSAVHTTGSPPTQVPEKHMSLRVHSDESLQAVPSVAGGWVHEPVAQTFRVQALPSDVQAPPSFAETQNPPSHPWHSGHVIPWHRSVQTPPESHPKPAGQVPQAWQPLGDGPHWRPSQSLGTVGWSQVPSVQTSRVQAFPSSWHVVPLVTGVAVHRVSASRHS
jgi:hypothetical protein